MQVVLKTECLSAIEWLVLLKRKNTKKNINEAKRNKIINILIKVNILNNDNENFNKVIVWIPHRMIIVRKQNSLQAKQPTLYLMDFRPLFPELIIKGLNKALKVFRHYFYLTPGKFIYELFFIKINMISLKYMKGPKIFLNLAPRFAPPCNFSIFLD